MGWSPGPAAQTAGALGRGGDPSAGGGGDGSAGRGVGVRGARRLPRYEGGIGLTDLGLWLILALGGCTLLPTSLQGASAEGMYRGR